MVTRQVLSGGLQACAGACSRRPADIVRPSSFADFLHVCWQRVDLSLQSVGPYLQDIPLFVTVPGLLERAALQVQTSVAVKGVF